MSVLTLYWRGRFGTLTTAWYPDLVEQRTILRQFLAEAGYHGAPCRVEENQYEAVLAAAGKHGWAIETIGGPVTTGV